MTTNDIILNARLILVTEPYYRVKVDDPKRVQRNLHKALKRRGMNKLRVSIDGDYIVVTQKGGKMTITSR